ncbi:MAG: hypothetical protein JXR40_02575 [Pontiellaceae bacterium]|nr:hypothetical protein [Pontiellaceae bacterium]
MITASQQNTAKSGFTLLAIMFFTAIITSFLAMTVFSSMQRMHTVKRLNDQTKAQMMAEAGCEWAYSILSTNWDARYTPSLFTGDGADESTFSSIDPKEFQIGLKTIGDNTAILSSTGTCGSVSCVSIVSLQNIGGSDDDGDVLSAEAFEYAVLCGGELDFSGCGTIVSPSGNSKFHANGDMFLRGTTDALIDLSSSGTISINNNVTVGGSVVAPSLSYRPSKVAIGGSATEGNVDIVEIPDIDLTPYYHWAAAHGEVHEGFSASSSYAPDGGVLWVNGDVHINSHAVISGSIIATGSITISGQADVEAGGTGFALAARDGDINITSSGAINGLIYANKGSLKYTANGTISGQIVVNGNIKKAGNSDIMTAFTQTIPSPPGGSVTTDYIAVAAWQK